MAKFAKIDGGYLYMTLDGIEYRVYLEQAGQGIPLVLQHTAGTDGRQWRYLLEDPYITKDFRVIAWDLPYHGKSVPPHSVRYWETGYKLEMSWFMRFVVGVGHELELDRPVFMGSSMGGFLAPDLALYYPHEFRAVIGLEPMAKSPEPGTLLDFYWHPNISNDSRAALMHTHCAPTSPEAYRRETIFCYSQGAPFVFPGDLYYYSTQHDLTETAKDIDTSKIDVYLLNGDYDWSGTVEEGRRLAAMIPGSKWTRMEDVGHFPMSENPEKFKKYLLPILTEIKAKSAAAALR
jgi:pimeloyl-ACP methyl ester carboxylesterase